MKGLATGLHTVPNDHLATVVTYLQMTTPPSTNPARFPAGYRALHDHLSVADYRALFRAIGAPWLWTSRLVMEDAELESTLQSPNVETWTIQHDETSIGLVELDFREPDACELAFFGLMQSATGKGLGKPMMALACERAFARPIKRFHVHTCTLDSPHALGFYQKAGFTPYKREVEVFPDPRITGNLPIESGAHIPRLD